MPTYVYVYSPLTAKSLGRDCYCYCCWDCNRPCPGCTHVSGGSSWGYPNPGFPIDIGGSSLISAGAAVRFYGTVDSIRTRRRTDFCASNPGAPYEDAVEVELYRYANASCYLGKLFYGHLYDRISDGVYNYPDGLLLEKFHAVVQRVIVATLACMSMYLVTPLANRTRISSVTTCCMQDQHGFTGG